jgi:repressor LexA
MSERTLQVLRTIEGLTRQAGFPPAVREVAKAVGLKSASTAMAHLWRLRQAGLVDWQTGTARTLRLTDAGRRALAGELAAEVEQQIG